MSPKLLNDINIPVTLLKTENLKLSQDISETLKDKSREEKLSKNI